MLKLKSILPSLVLGLIIITSCSLERKIALDYANKKNKGAVLIIAPDFIYKDAVEDYFINKDDTIPHYEVRENQVKHLNIQDSLKLDSVLLKNALYLNYVKDKPYLDTCFLYFRKRLESFGYNVYTYDQLDDFMKLKDTSYIIKLAQIQIEQKVINSPDAVYEIYGRVHDFEVKINSLDVNAWFELERTNVKDESFPVLYTSHSISDFINGEVIGDNLAYSRDSISAQDIANLPKVLGGLYAVLFQDYFLNLYVMEKMPKGNPPLNYYNYIKEKRMLIRAAQGHHFVELDQEL